MQRSFLNLTHNPFVPPREGFFPGADRQTHLDHLRHLSQWSRRILVVTGPFGIGKSTLYRELSNTLEPKATAARLSGTVATTERDVLVSLVQGFGVAASPEASTDEMFRLVIAHAEKQEEHDRFCMVMVDEGHLLDPIAIYRLMALVGESSIRVVMFAESSVVNAITRSCKRLGIEWFEIRLTGFPKNDLRDYLEWRFRQAQYRGLLPFTDEQVDGIAARSGGNPGAIDNLANELLSKLETGELKRQKEGFPVVHAVLAVLLTCVVGLVYILVQQEDERPAATLEVARSAQEGEEPGPEPTGPAGARASVALQDDSAGVPFGDQPTENLDIAGRALPAEAEAAAEGAIEEAVEGDGRRNRRGTRRTTCRRKRRSGCRRDRGRDCGSASGRRRGGRTRAGLGSADAGTGRARRTRRCRGFFAGADRNRLSRAPRAPVDSEAGS